MIPEDLRYTPEHEWVSTTAATGVVRIGITDFAQDALGDIVYVQLPDAGAKVTAGDSLGEVESTKSVSDIFAPIDGTVTASNGSLMETPELLNTDPYGEGWLVEIESADQAALGNLLDAAAYRKLTESA
ncbi:MAG: glycine cleavage system protein GcvH [Micromonosporaceae bacterium]